MGKYRSLLVLALVPCSAGLVPSFLTHGVRPLSLSHLTGLGATAKKSDPDYERRLLEAAGDPGKFESFVLQRNTTMPKHTEVVKKTGAYQRIEEWDAELKQRAKNGSMSWEERVQYEGQKHGDQFRQNEILRRNLNSF